ncbi:hypothetical protein ACIO3O_25450 [Streptomyces sp. NPDC087440]|uniref:hypothetical protein n=1 Tax=Streptomyces sp. NPDC087440 TaxID=3365790 RepID=UPI00381024DE
MSQTRTLITLLTLIGTPVPTPQDRLIIRSTPLLRDHTARHRAATARPRTDRPAWHSPYGPPPRRAHRGRWSPVPGVTTSRPTERYGYLCGRCD